MSTTTTDPTVGLEIIEHLDFTPQWECELSSHPRRHVPDDPGWGIIVCLCPRCKGRSELVICKSGWESLHLHVVVCTVCHKELTPGVDIRLLTVLP